MSTFREFQETNRRRCEEGFGHAVAWNNEYWPLQNWALAIAGEAGELCNLVKKCLRGDFTVEEKREEILHELADVMTYCDLAISSLGADTGETVWRKFDEVSKRKDWTPRDQALYTQGYKDGYEAAQRERGPIEAIGKPLPRHFASEEPQGRPGRS